MIVLWVLLALVALVVLILFSSVSLDIRWDEEAQIRLRFWFLRFDLLRLLQSPGEEKKKKKQAESAASQGSEKKKKRTAGEFLDFLRFLSRLLKEGFRQLLSRAKIRVNRLELTVAHEEPDRTAILYGLACPAVYQLCETVKRFTRSRIDYRRVAVTSDFTAKSFRARLDLRVSLRVLDFLAVLVKVLALLQEIKISSGGKDYERNSIEASH